MASPIKLKRSLSLPLVTLYGLGTTIGAGIYVLIGKVAGVAGLLAPVSFLAAGLLAALTAFSFAELSARIPRSAGEAAYVRAGFGSERLALLVGLLVVAVGVIAAAAVTVGAAGYIREFIDLPGVVLIVVPLVLLALVAAWGIGESVAAAALFTLLEIGGLGLVIWAGSRAALATGGDLSAPLDALSELGDAAAWGGIWTGAILAFYAFIGFEDMVNVAEEVKDVERTLPRAIILTLALTTLLYLAVSVVAVLALPPAELAASEAPLARIYEAGTGGSPALIVAIGIFATLNGVLIQIIMASRVLYGLSAQGQLPDWLGAVNPRTRTPLIATGLVTLGVLVLALGFPIEVLAEATSLVALSVFALVNLALWRLKGQAIGPSPGLSVPRWLPLTGFLVSGFFALAEVLRLLGG